MNTSKLTKRKRARLVGQIQAAHALALTRGQPVRPLTTRYIRAAIAKEISRRHTVANPPKAPQARKAVGYKFSVRAKLAAMKSKKGQREPMGWMGRLGLTQAKAA